MKEGLQGPLGRHTRSYEGRGLEKVTRCGQPGGGRQEGLGTESSACSAAVVKGHRGR